MTVPYIPLQILTAAELNASIDDLSSAVANVATSVTTEAATRSAADTAETSRAISAEALFAPRVLSIAALRSLTTLTMRNPLVYVIGYATNMDGGEGTFSYVASDATTSDNGGTVIVDASARRWYRAGVHGSFNPQWFGAKFNGITNDNAAHQAAINAAMAVNGAVVHPAGSSIFTALTAVNGSKSLSIQGAGRGVTKLLCNSITGDALTLALGFGEVRDLTIGSTVNRTAGTSLDTTCNVFNATNVGLDGFYRGVWGKDNGGTFRDLFFSNPALGATGMVISGYGANLLIDNAQFYQGAFQAAAGIQLIYCGEAIISNCGIVGYGIDLLINPGPGQTVAAVYAHDTFFDTAGTGVFIAATGTGNVVRVRFANCWMCSHTGDGVTIVNNGSGIVQGIHFVDCMAMFNRFGSGINVVGGANSPRDVTVLGGTFADNIIGVNFGAGVSDFSVIGASAGLYGGALANSSVGIAVAVGGSDHYIIANNRVRGNPVIGVSDGGTGTNKSVAGNVT